MSEDIIKGLLIKPRTGSVINSDRYCVILANTENEEINIDVLNDNYPDDCDKRYAETPVYITGGYCVYNGIGFELVKSVKNTTLLSVKQPVTPILCVTFSNCYVEIIHKRNEEDKIDWNIRMWNIASYEYPSNLLEEENIIWLDNIKSEKDQVIFSICDSNSYTYNMKLKLCKKIYDIDF